MKRTHHKRYDGECPPTVCQTDEEGHRIPVGEILLGVSSVEHKAENSTKYFLINCTSKLHEINKKEQCDFYGVLS